ncbi:hypothetical protein SISSUDRAFT_1059315 [Sistotremastrum suecicum HHB10207 ss-3]|uniref:NADP-dependent oxidoreductase domain-containing protein n=1 Tax=Sistotremastrum suecicum HHB10207 ss-3 TaxID=1314776 RepID=A0A166GDZ2_9AGAM|nr:hypothetical protein SISSUDRAFT_1059315 [Sistotremastrum suecicum HHB10207 ss-3]
MSKDVVLMRHITQEREMIAYCNHQGIGLIPYGALSAGVLARPAGTETARTIHDGGSGSLSLADLEIIKRLEEIALKKGWKMSHVALAWVMSKVASPIVGISTITRLDDAIISNKKLTGDEVRYLEEPYVPKEIQGFA